MYPSEMSIVENGHHYELIGDALLNTTFSKALHAEPEARSD
jgi:hypothetical protein